MVLYNLLEKLRLCKGKIIYMNIVMEFVYILFIYEK